ncbi:MAG: stage V sporulation protein AC [Firmicutes bacterium]|nr:stage V sporulation protein AC [Bacillota bacterium]
MATEKEKKDYGDLVKSVTPNSHIFKDCIKAFVSGGAICTIGQFITDFCKNNGFSEPDAALICTIVLILASVILTGLGIYNKLGKFCGAGTIVPVTGFANSVASPAVEFKKEGFVFGVGAKMFAVAGPVIVYGTLSSFIVGLIYYFLG